MLARMSRQSSRIDLRANLAQNIRLARSRLGITQEQLAELSDLHQTYVSDVERGKRNVTLDVVMRLAEAVRSSPLELLANPPTS